MDLFLFYPLGSNLSTYLFFSTQIVTMNSDYLRRTPDIR
jgi:hypothetical protein